MPTEAEIAWAAGLFEGEGCFRITNSRGKSQCAVLALQMTDRDTVERFRAIVGSTSVRPTPRPAGHKTIYATDLARRDDVERIIRLFLPWLGERRKAKALELLGLIDGLNAAATRRAKFCPKGHLRTPENTYVNPKGYGICRACKRDRAREWNKNKYATDTAHAERVRRAARESGRRKRADPEWNERLKAQRRASYHRKRAGGKPASSQLEIGSSS